MINLCECKPGDCLVAKDGSLFFYSQCRENGVYKHIIKRRLTHVNAIWAVNNNGKHLINEDYDIDIIEIIPLETPNFYFTTYEKIRLYNRAGAIA
jgi:hypothetical protein